ncbi:hypothetical protein E4T92_02740 [Pasteurella sp. WM03]|nr:hypothetical protein [Pasteurella sp. 19428wF3_WM03]TFU52427.1 hypothetical protein E4T92_02740 [Pasteurella sp. WM03]
METLLDGKRIGVEKNLSSNYLTDTVILNGDCQIGVEFLQTYHVYHLKALCFSFFTKMTRA